jgi:hypothetical protein
MILARQLKEANGGYGLGWDYVAPNPARIDSSVTGWNVMALKSASGAGLNVGDGMAGAKNWLKKAWEATNPDFKNLTDPYKDVSKFPYTWNPSTNAFDVGAPGAPSKDLAPVGALCSVFLGHHAGDMMLESLCNYIVKHQFPTSSDSNSYYMYYNTLAIFQAGGDRWKKWNETVRDMLVKGQRKGEGCFDGSWDVGVKWPGSDSGRVLATAYKCLCLEVYYRYLPVGAKGDKAKAKE